MIRRLWFRLTCRPAWRSARDSAAFAEQAWTRVDDLGELLLEALDEYADHDSWRCAYPPHYCFSEESQRRREAEGRTGCPCGYDEWEARARAAISRVQT